MEIKPVPYYYTKQAINSKVRLAKMALKLFQLKN